MTKSSIIKFQDPETTSRGLVEKGSSELDQLVIIPVGDSIGIDGFPISSSISTMTFGGGEEKFTSANVTSDTIFCAGSVTKMITAVTMLRMTEEDQYKEHFPDGAETKLSTILPTLKKHFPHSKYITEDLETQPNFEEITLRDLAQHTSGLSNFSGKDLIGEVYDSVNQRIPKDMLDTAKSPRTGQHGEQLGAHSYNNLGYELLGRVIVAVARETEPTKEFGDVVNELVIDRVKEKVGPEKSATVKFFTADQMEIGPDGKTKVKAHPGLTVEFGKHYHDKKFLQVVPSCIYHDMTAGGGYTTPESMSCIAFHVLTDKAEFSIFKKPETLAVFNSSQVKLSDGSTYGFGYRSTLANPKLRGHGGLDFGSNSGVVVDIEANKVATTMLAFENLTLPIAYALKHKAKSTEPIELDSELHAKTLELSKNYSEAQLLEMRNDLEKSYEDFAEKFGVISKQRSEALDLAPHSILINCAKKLGYSFDDRGMCFGIAMRWIEASLTDAEEIFMDRMDKIKSINSALDRGMTISAINKEDLSDVKAFFESASLYQQPRLHHGLLSKSIEQQDLAEIAEIASSDKVKERGGVKVQLTNGGVYSESEIIQYLNNVTEAICSTECKNTVSFVLDGKGHAIGLSFFPEERIWRFMDINSYPPYDGLTTEQASKMIFDTFLREQSTGYVAFNTRMIVLGENTHLEEAVKPLKSSLDDHALSIFGAMNPVCEAAKINNHEAILALKRAGADMNEVDDMGRSPIHYAAYHGHCDTIATLKDLGANIDVYTRDQKTALHVAAYRNQYDATNLLLSLNANPNLSDEHGSTPLHFVSGRKESDINIGFKLVEYGANPNSPDSDGVTPLVLATQTGKSELVQCFQKCAQQPAVSEKIPSPSPEKSYAEKMSQVKGSNSKEI